MRMILCLGLCLLNLYLSKAAFRPRVYNHSAVAESPNVKLWKDMVKLQKNIDQVVMITDDGTCPLEFGTSMCFLPSKFNSNSMKLVHHSMVTANRKPLFLLSSYGLEMNLPMIIKAIRKYDYESFIIVKSKSIIQGLGPNIFFVVESKDVMDTYEIYETCSFCNDEKDTIQKINYWSYQRGFRKTVPLTKSFKGSFNNHSLKFGYPRYTIHRSFYSEVLSPIEKSMNVSVKPAYKISHQFYNNKSLNLILNGNLDISTHVIILLPKDNEIHLTFPFIVHRRELISAAPSRRLVKVGFLQPYRPAVWVLFLISLAASHITIWAIRKYRGCTGRFSHPLILLGAYKLLIFFIVIHYKPTFKSFVTKMPYQEDPIDFISTSYCSTFYKRCRFEREMCSVG